jgi:hypothetical protein
MKKLFTTILMMGVALCGWATITETPDGTTVTLNYVADGNSNDQNFSLSNKNATKIVLTGDWANKDLKKIGTIVGQCSGQVYLDMSACSNMVSMIQSTGEGDIDWTSNNYKFIPSPGNPLTVPHTGTATKEVYYYYSNQLKPDGTPHDWAQGQNYTGTVYSINGKYYDQPQYGQELFPLEVYLDEKGNELPKNATVEENNGTYTYSYTENIAQPFKLTGADFDNNTAKLNGISFPNNANFTAIPDDVFGQDGLSSLSQATVGSDLIYIGKSAFKNSQLTSFAFPAGLKAIGGEAFHGAPLSEINLGACESLVAIKYEAFEEVNQNVAINVTFPASATFTFLGNDAFQKSGVTRIEMVQCTGITEFQSKDNDGTTFKTFANCPNLTYVSLPPNLTAVPDDNGMGVFKGSINIAEVKFNGSGSYVNCVLKNACTIGDNAFKFAQQSSTGGDTTEEEIVLNKLAKVTLSNNISSIGVEAFHSAAISEIHIPASVQELKKHCFYGCQNLTKVFFDEFDKNCGTCDGAETQIAGAEGSGGQGQGAFEECQNITDVYINTQAELQCANNAFDQDISWGAGNVEGNFATLHFPKNKTEHYVNLAHYLTDAIVANAGLFHDWLEDHYDQAINPHKNGWYEFINSGPTDPDDKTVYQEIMLRTFSDWTYSYLVPNGLRAYVVTGLKPVGDNYEVTLQRIRVIPAKTGVILYGHPNGKKPDNSLALVLTPVNYLKHGDPLYDQKYVNGELVSCDIEYNEDGTMKVQDYYQGEDQGLPLCRANWNHSSNYVKNYLEPIISEDGSAVAIKPYEKAANNKVTFRNFALGRYSSTDYFTKTKLDEDENNYVGFFRMKPQSYKSGYAYLRLTGDVDENGVALENPEFNVADGGEILVKPDTDKDITNGIYPYYYEVNLTDGSWADMSVQGDNNPKGWWNASASPVGFYWKEYSMSWGDRTIQFGSSAGAKYFGEFEDDTDGIVKLVVPAESIPNGEYYTLQGVKVAHPTKGVYIHNGKKVVIK